MEDKKIAVIAADVEQSGLTETEYIDFFIEQFRLERIAYDKTIEILVSKLSASNMDETGIPDTRALSDHCFERLVRYRLGISGKLFRAHRLLLPYSLRRSLLKKIE